MVDALVSNTSDFTVMRVRVSLPALDRKPSWNTGVAFSFGGRLGERWEKVSWNNKRGLMERLITSDGSYTVYSEKYGVTYHSRHGAVTESGHVFINAGLRFKGVVQREISILEAGFGTGLNAFMTWLEAERRNFQVDYTGLELFPIELDSAISLGYPEVLGIPERRSDFLHLHQLEWGVQHVLSDNFRFCKRAESIETHCAPERYDLIYFDAFAPQAQPELWSNAVFEQLYESLRPEGILVTYCAQGAFKRTLKRAGFSVERLQGPPGKREMTRATK